MTAQPGIELRARQSDWSALMAHLFPGDGDEHGAALLCGSVTTSSGTRLLLRELVLATDGRDYVPGTRGYRHLTGEFVTAQIRRAKDQGLVYLAVHNHGSIDSVGFSRPDLNSHERAYPTLLALTQLPVGALVCARRAVAGDIWFPDGSRAPLDRVDVVGSRRELLTPTRQPSSARADERFHRQALLFGADGQALLASTRVVVVGAGGVGMLLVQYLARLGAGNITVVDPERVDPTNLPRLPEATRLDAMEYLDRERLPRRVRTLAKRLAAPKVRVARRIARRANPNVTLVPIVGDIADDQVATLAKDADFIFLAADTMLARDVVNQLSYQYLVPALQVGSKIVVDPTSGAVTDTFGVVRHVGLEPGCLRCAGLIDPARLSEEALGDPEQVRRQRYIDDPEIEAPSVITLNALGSGFAANDFMLSAVGHGGADPAHRVLRNRPVGWDGAHVTIMEPTPQAGCPVCSMEPYSALSRGDGIDLPTRVGRRR
jgi:molybdopterin/thiamine biosynthesis adenylyltransferase